ncbi:MAG: transcriptional regulator [Planctomycetota bacterium]|nr:transcriptional regulator [Planctomycetota bacterium]
MPESTPNPDAEKRLHESQERFITLWGQMASNWGIPRTMAETHALLFLSDEPLNTDDVMERLDVSRGSASMTLRALLDWGIASRVHQRGDRKEYFQAEQDVWKLFRTLLRERKKREIEPLLAELHTCRELSDSIKTRGKRKRALDPETARLKAFNYKLDDMISFVEMIDAFSNRLMNSSGKGLELAAKLLAKAS